MHIIQSLSVALIVALFSCSAQRKVVYPDDTRPGITPQIFSPTSISLPRRLEQSITFSRDGKEWYYGATDSQDWWYRSILRTRVLRNGSTITDTPAIIRNFSFAKDAFIGEPFLSFDGNELYFVAGLPPDIWVSKRSASGDWQTPVLLDSPVNSRKGGEWNPSLSKSGTLFFASSRTDSGRIYKAPRVSGSYTTAVLLKGGLNSDDAGDPCTASDESFLFFSSWRPGGFGGTDLYVSYALSNGSWSDPINMGSSVNTKEEEVGPRISPDGRYLFFHRRDKWQNATASDIYWVDMQVVTMHPKK